MISLPRHLVNGRQSDHVSVLDRGLRYGDGCFETMAVRQGQIRLWDRHYERLARSCDRLSIQLDVGQRELADELAGLIGDTADAVLRLTVTRGTDSSGYRISPDTTANRIASLLPDRSHPASYWEDGIRVRLCETRLSRNPLLAGIKHLNRLEQVLARNEWQEGYVEGLLSDDQGNVVEGTITNLFIIEGKQLVTPKLDQCGVAGVMRAETIDRAREAGIDLKEANINRRRLLAADGCFLTNALIGIWPVTMINNEPMKITRITQQLMISMKDLLPAEPADRYS